MQRDTMLRSAIGDERYKVIEAIGAKDEVTDAQGTMVGTGRRGRSRTAQLHHSYADGHDSTVGEPGAAVSQIS